MLFAVPTSFNTIFLYFCDAVSLCQPHMLMLINTDSSLHTQEDECYATPESFIVLTKPSELAFIFISTLPSPAVSQIAAVTSLCPQTDRQRASQTLLFLLFYLDVFISYSERMVSSEVFFFRKQHLIFISLKK